MTTTEQMRLAALRADLMKWVSWFPESEMWDTFFLITIIDEKNRRIKELEDQCATLQRRAM